MAVVSEGELLMDGVATGNCVGYLWQLGGSYLATAQSLAAAGLDIPVS